MNGVVSKRIKRTKIHSCDLAVTAAFGFEVDLLAFAKRLKSGALNSRDVHENVVATFFRLNKAVALLTIKPLHSPVRHSMPPKHTCVLRQNDRRPSNRAMETS
jgi:hypothetical protein